MDQQQSGLFRSRNYTDLNDESRDFDRRHRRETPLQDLSQSSEQNLHYPSQSLAAIGADELAVDRVQVGGSRYINLDANTQTSFTDDGVLYTDDSQYNNLYNKIQVEQEEKQQEEPIVEAVPVNVVQSENKPHEPSTAIQAAQKLNVLRHLLSVERKCSEQRRQNVASLQKYLKGLQTDYLRQQHDLIDALELSHKIKEQKESEIEVLNETIREKDKLIEQLKARIESLDESKLRAEFQAAQAKQNELFELERQQFKEQIASGEQQLVRERICNAQTLQQFQDKLNEKIQLHELETSRLKDKAASVQRELEHLTNEPQNLVIKTLREEKFQLQEELDEMKMALDETRCKYEKLRRKLEVLQVEQEQDEQRNQAEIERLEELCGEQRKLATDRSQELDNQKEIVQLLQFNLQRSEKRVKNLLGALRGKEVAYNEIINQLSVKNEQLSEKSSAELRLLERSLNEKSAQLDKNQNELKRIEMEYENRLESMRNDRDQRIHRLTTQLQSVEQELQAAELKFAQEIELHQSKSNSMDQLKNELSHYKQECKRLAIDLLKCEAKLSSKQQELEKTSSGHYEEIGTNRTLSEEQHQQVVSVYELEEARRYATRLEDSLEDLRKDNEKLGLKLRVSESNLVKLNASITKEQAKLYRDCEKKLSQIVSDQCNYNKYKMRYKKYGNKLKRYYQHLKQVHEHLCSTETCGTIAQNASEKGSVTHISSRDSETTRCSNDYSYAW